VGAYYDVLVTVGAPPEALRWWSALLVVGLMVLSGVVVWRKAELQMGG
jgi:hypothetical protein